MKNYSLIKWGEKIMPVNNKLNDKIIVAFEGVYGTGKTTIARLIAEKNNYRFIHCPPDDYNRYKRFIENRFQIFPSIRFFFYLSTVWEVYQDILQDNVHKVFLVDRYILSTLVYHKVLFEKSGLEELLRLLQSEIFPPQPDLNIVLYSNANIRKERISKRNMHNPSFVKRLEKDQVLQEEIQTIYKSLPNINLIDTSFESIEEVVFRCEALIKKTIYLKANKMIIT